MKVLSKKYHKYVYIVNIFILKPLESNESSVITTSTTEDMLGSSSTTAKSSKVWNQKEKELMLTLRRKEHLIYN